MNIKLWDVDAGNEFGNPNLIEDDREMEEGWEETMEKCEECKVGILRVFPAQNGDDDCDYIYECGNCGAVYD